MFTNFALSTDLLREYSDFEKANQDWSILSYLNYNFDTNAALAFSKLFLPDFIEEKGCIILAFFYNSQNFIGWYNEFNGNVSNVERMCNLYELKDFFHINDSYESSKNELLAFGKALEISWEMNLKKLFPLKTFNIEIFEEYNSIYITFYQVR